MSVRLRIVDDADVDQFFEWQRDPGAVAMAAFTRADPSDREAFDRHYRRIRGDSDCTWLAIDDDGVFAGTIGSFTMDREREVTYWIDPSRWGRGLASRALDAFARVELARPLFARVAEHNIGSTKVLARAGFVQVGSETSPADGVGRDVVEHIYVSTTSSVSPHSTKQRRNGTARDEVATGATTSLHFLLPDGGESLAGR
jgi:RimJ/RimL family protein N-acetyltransferase